MVTDLSNTEQSSQKLLSIDKELASSPSKVILSGSNLTISEVLAVARNGAQVEFTTDQQVLDRIQKCYDKMIENVKDGIPIYGCNSGYGARASNVLNEGSAEERLDIAKKMSEGIVHIDVTTGPPFSREVVRAAMLIRINMLMNGVSAVKIADLEIYRQMLNHNITPVVGQYGGIGASGDLAHNCRILSAARQLPGVRVWDPNGNIVEAAEALGAAGIPALQLDSKAGLGLVNGDNFSSAVAVLLYSETVQAILAANVLGAMVTEVLNGTDRQFHPVLSNVRPHHGQKEVATLYRYLLNGSKLAYQEMKGAQPREKGVSVQDAYSLRCIAQYHGVNFEKLESYYDTIVININSASDNPLWVPPEHAVEGEEPWQWVSGGNFIAMHMAEVMDGLRKIMTQIVKLNDRQLARMVSPYQNNGLPPNLSDAQAISQCTFKGVQIQSGMFDVYSTLLSMPVTTMFGIHEENNQDITSHALTSGILGLENLRITQYSIAQNLLAVAQAADLRGDYNLLSERTKPVYKLVRAKAQYTEIERPLNNDIESLYQSVKSGELMNVIRSEVLNEY